MVGGSNTHPSPIIKEPTMDKFTRKSSFEQWISPINFKNISKQIKILKLDHYTKKLDTSSFIKLLLFSQLIECESLRAMSDIVFSEDLQKTLGFSSISYSQLSRKLNEVQLNFFNIFSCSYLIKFNT